MFSGKVFAITGGASGLGLATARVLVQRGAKVSIGDMSSQLESAATKISQSVTEQQRKEQAAAVTTDDAVFAQKVDVRDLSQVQSWLKATVDRFGTLDGAVNAAGSFDYPSLKMRWHEQRGIDTFEPIISTNLIGLANCMHAELECMSAASEMTTTNSGGVVAGRGAGSSSKSIVNLSSVAGIKAAGSPAYVASKHGVIGLSKILAREYASAGIRINAVCPGMIRTPMTDNLVENMGQEAVNRMVAFNPMPRMGEPVEVANVIAFLLSEESSYVTGAVHTIDGAMSV